MCRRFTLFVLAWLFTHAVLSAQTMAAEPYEVRLARAEALGQEGSYAMAEAAYRALLVEPGLTQAQQDYLLFRQADAAWRSLVATRQTDAETLERQRRVLVDLADALERRSSGREPLLWAQIQESLGDSWWMNPYVRDWHQAWPYYERTLKWWAGSTELDEARKHYLGLVFRVTGAVQPGARWSFGGGGAMLPVGILENAVKIAQTVEERAQANYLLAMTLMQSRGASGGGIRLAQAFEASLAGGRATSWYDDALYQFAQWTEQQGKSGYTEQGGWQVRGDPEAALVLYRRLVSEFGPGESRYYREAERAIQRITAEELSVLVSNQFLPGSILDFNLNWRNLNEVRIAIYRIDPEEDLRLPGSEPAGENRMWTERVSLAGKSPVFTRTLREEGGSVYVRNRERITLNEGLPSGLYIIEGSGGEVRARAWLLVTRAGLLAKVTRDGLHVFSADVVTGEPLPDASLLCWSYREARTRTWVRSTGSTGKDGLGKLPLQVTRESPSFVLFAKTREGPSLIEMRHGHYWPDTSGGWRVYAFTDRPAYRPEDTVSWKFFARVREGESAYTVPAGQTLNWRIMDPRGSLAAEGSAELNDYGSAWGELELSTDMPLGIYRIEFSHSGEKSFIGSEELFRLEEYKLPEYRVSVSTAGSDGDVATAFLPGDEVEVAIQADYYFGGGVADAEVEVVVTRSPFYSMWRPWRPYPWLGRGTQMPQPWMRGQTEEVQREQLVTDERGRAVLRLQTDPSGQADWEYQVEARVVDASRREIVGRATVKVTRQAYFVYLDPARTLYRPGETAEVRIRTLNANENPVSVSGRVTLTRQHWEQVWAGPGGEKINGEEYRMRLRQRRGLFSRSFDAADWKLEREGYEHDEIVSLTLESNEKGEALFSQVLPRAGMYQLSWFSQDERGYPIRQTTTLWAGDSSTLDIGYHGNLKIVADADSFRAGGKTPVMLTAPSAGRYVWFTVEADGLIESRVVRMEGNVSLLNLDVTDAWVPNVNLTAAMFEDTRLQMDIMAVSVPPVAQFLDVRVSPEAGQTLPRSRQRVTLETRDHEGRPVSAEVALSVFDEAVLYIQPALAPDPREFFYGSERQIRVQSHNSVQRPAFRREPVARVRSGSAAAADHAALGRTFGGGGEAQLGLGQAFSRSNVRLMAVPTSEMAAEADFYSAPAPAMKAMGGDAMAAEEPAVQVRTDFRATVFWEPAIMTDAEGRATVEVAYPDSLTTWQAVARAASLPGKVGIGEARVQTSLPVIARLQGPRFLVTGDEVVLSGVINNNTDAVIETVVSLAVEGEALSLDAKPRTVAVAPGGQARVDFSAQAVLPGDAKLTLTVRGGDHADAMERTIPVFERGIDKFLTQSGKMTTDSLRVTLDMPAFRSEGASLEINATPSLAATMLDALPYLAEYPYGCVEQTMSRFLPAVIVAKTLSDLGLSEKDVVERAFGGITDRDSRAAENLYNLDAMVTRGLERLYDMQRDDGGWGWWKGGEGDPFMTAYVVWGLTLAEQAGVSVRGDVLKRSRDYLDSRLVEAEVQPDLAAWMLHALSARFVGRSDPSPSRFEARAFAEAWKERDRLNAYTRALLTLSAKAYGFGEEAAVLARNLRNGVVVENNPQGSILAAGNPVNEAMLQTARWGRDGVFFRWSEGATEATAFCLMALLAVEGETRLTEQASNWLIQNRRGAQWSNTRDTAITVLALNRYLLVSGELDAALEYEIEVNGETVAHESIAPKSGPLAPSVFAVDASLLREGENAITFRRLGGEAPLYFSARASFFTLEDPIRAAGNVVFTSREFTLLRPIPTLLDGWQEERVPLESGTTVASGDRIEVTLVVEAKNDLEYLVFEDLKAAGLEAVALQSGAPLYARELRMTLGQSGILELPKDEQKRYTGRQRWVYQELRDRQVAAFVDKLPEGFWELRYVLRAETPGVFAAMPVLGHAMYVPEIRANSDEFKISIVDKVQ